MSVGQRWLWIALLLTVVAALWPVPEDDAAEDAALRASKVRNRAAERESTAAPQLGSLGSPSQAPKREIIDLFPRQGAAAPAMSAAPEEPMAPALPFTYGGRYTEGGKTFVFLIEGARMHAVRQGDIVKATYRVEKIAPTAITLTYLPFGLQQTLPAASATAP